MFRKRPFKIKKFYSKTNKIQKSTLNQRPKTRWANNVFFCHKAVFEHRHIQTHAQEYKRHVLPKINYIILQKAYSNKKKSKLGWQLLFSSFILIFVKYNDGCQNLANNFTQYIKGTYKYLHYSQRKFRCLIKRFMCVISVIWYKLEMKG